MSYTGKLIWWAVIVVAIFGFIWLLKTANTSALNRKAQKSHVTHTTQKTNVGAQSQVENFVQTINFEMAKIDSQFKGLNEDLVGIEQGMSQFKSP